MPERESRCRCRYEIIQDEPGQPLVIADCNLGHMSLTNDAEAVVAELHACGYLPDSRTLLYYDSGGDLGMILHCAGDFIGFSPPPPQKTQQHRRP